MAKILVVEDSPDIRALIRMLLEPEGHEVVTANDGPAGVAAAREERPDLILMDLSLPILSGWEAAKEIKADPATNSIPVLAVTAHAMHGDKERALAAGCDGFIAKPIDGEVFPSQIAPYLKRREKEPREPEGVRPLRAAAPEQGRILVVDDHREVAELIRADLEAEGHEITVAASGEEAVSLLSRAEPFDLAVVDVMLGGDSGYECTEQLIARSAEYLPVLLITAGTINREKGYEAGADDFIGKPIESAELKARTRSLIRIGRSMREQGRSVKERAEAYEKLASLDRLRSDFLSTVSHELRTPLNTIILLSHLIGREANSPAGEERRVHDVRVIRESAETLLRMINNILDLAKLEAGQEDLHAQRIPLREFLRELADMLEPQAREKGLALALELDPTLPETAILDREKLSRVLINLLSNAVKYTSRGEVVLRASGWQDSISFEVRDTGVGIPGHLIPAAFEPFRQIRTDSGDAPRGTGLGLSISKQLVELMKADLLFDSREGVGTRASFTLPQLPELEAAPVPEPWRKKEAPEGLDAAGKARRIMVVEDDEFSRYGLKSLLESEGYEVTEAATLAETEIVVGKKRPDVLILDITLPDGDGAEWLKRTRKRSGDLSFPVIALTGVTADEDRRRIEQAGVSAVLHKPVNVSLLFGALKESLMTK